MGKEIEILRAAIHAMARDKIAGSELPDWVGNEEQEIVDYYISRERNKAANASQARLK